MARPDTEGMYDTAEAPAVPGRLRLVIVDGDEFRTEVLPTDGAVQIGRSRQCEVVIDNTSISRVHARIDVGEILTIEDLGSANGTFLGERRLAARTPTPFGVGDAVALGAVTMVVQKSSAQTRAKRIWPHGYFEGRLEEEVMRGERVRSEFAVVRVIGGETGEARVLEDAIAATVRSIDVLGCYSPHDYEVLLTDCTREVANKVVMRLHEQLRARGLTARVGVACYPADGRTADDLIELAAAPPRRRSRESEPPPPMVDGGMGRLEALTRRVAASSISVLILGETGVGKEVLAGTIHRLSPRADKPFLALNCASLTESLLESELFGHERGAFTGAIAAKPGLFETAHTGTVFLDEVGDLPQSTQVKLLRVLEDRLVMRVGALKPKPIDVRFLAATNRDLEGDVERGTFRRDLYFRLNGITLQVPPLRERRREIVGLALAFAADSARRAGLAAPPTLDAAATAMLLGYTWPGNIRELRNVMERAVVLSGGGAIGAEHLPVEKMRATLPQPTWGPDEVTEALTPARLAELGRRAERPRPPRPPRPPTPVPRPTQPFDQVELYDQDTPVPELSFDPNEYEPEPTVPGPPAASAPSVPARPADLRGELGALERQRIVEALERCGGNQKKAAQELGISRGTLVARLDAYGIARPRKNR